MQVAAVRRIGACLQHVPKGKRWSEALPMLDATQWSDRLTMPDIASTPLLALSQHLHVKLEGAHAGGSVKDRAVTQCVFGMLKSGSLQPGGTLALCTSGSAGVSLLRAQRLLQAQGVNINVKIFMPEAYVAKQTPQVIVKTEGVVVERHAPELCLSRSLCPFDGDFVSTLANMKDLAAEHDWAILDQHYDVNSMLAHESTAVELVQQCPALTDVVCTTGTGGTAAGLREFLPSHITVHARPAHSGTLDGCTDVRRYGNFCDPDLLEGYTTEFFCPEEAKEQQEELRQRYHIECGPSSGAAFGLAQQVLLRKPSAKIAVICADGKLTRESCNFKAALSSPMKGVVQRGRVFAH